jgi:hypothetical protein
VSGRSPSDDSLPEMPGQTEYATAKVVDPEEIIPQKKNTQPPNEEKSLMTVQLSNSQTGITIYIDATVDWPVSMLGDKIQEKEGVYLAYLSKSACIWRIWTYLAVSAYIWHLCMYLP